MTRDEIEREVGQIMQGQSLPERAPPLFIAFFGRLDGLPIDQECPYCQGAIWARGSRACMDLWRSPCGRCTNSCRGL